MKTLKAKICKYDYIDESQEIAHHEVLKQLSSYAYGNASENLPDGYKLVDEKHSISGLDAYVLKKDKEIIIAFRGTQFSSFSDVSSDVIILADKIPLQAKEAANLCNEIIVNFPDSDITVTGHSLGGGIGAYGAAKNGLPAVTFNPLGVAGLIKENEKIDDSRIVNYCNPRDWTPSGSSKEHLGKCYEIGSKAFTSRAEASLFAHHYVENMEDLRTRKPITKDELSQKYKKYRDSMPKYYQTAIEAYKETFGLKHFTSNDCAGTYPVSGYTRDDGTKVQGYNRTCGAKHQGSWRGKRFDQMTDAEVDQMLEDLI